MFVTEGDFYYAMDAIQLAGRISVDTETTGLDVFGTSVVVGVSVATPAMETFYFSFRHKDTDNLPEERFGQLVSELFKHPWTGWNLGFDLKMLRKEYWRFFQASRFPPKCEDLMLASHLLDENQPNFKLKDTGDRFGKFLHRDLTASTEQRKLDDYMMDRALGHGDMWMVGGEIVAPYAEEDVRLCEQLRAMFLPALERWSLSQIYEEICEYLITVVKMEERGLALDLQRVAENSSHCKSEAARCLQDIKALAQMDLNPNSAKKFKEFINQRLLINYSTSVTSTDVTAIEEALEVVKDDDPLSKILQLALDYRRNIKADSTYYKAFMDLSRRGVVHPNLHMAGTATGRFSSSNPNLQAIPRKEKVDLPKNHIKEVFVARPGFWLFQADFKQAEIYLGAHFANSQSMADMLLAGIDVHQATADLMGGIPRSVAKRLNFAVQYGIGATTFKKDIKEQAGIVISEQQAWDYIKRYREAHPEMAALYQRSEAMAKTNGFIRLITGRVRRYNGEERFGKTGTKPSPHHKASSNLVQGSVAEVMRLVSTEISRQLDKRAYQLLHVHDSIIGEVREGDIDTLLEIKRIMEIDHVGETKLLVPMKVDIEVGTRWSDLKPMGEVLVARTL